MKKFSTSFIYDLTALFVVAVWGMTFISTTLLLKHYTPSQIFFVRFAVAYLGMIPFARKRLFADTLKDELRMALAGITGGSVYFICENTALQVSHQASCISFIVCTTPLVTALLAILLRRKGAKMTLPLAVGSIVAVAGMAMVMLNGSVFLGVPVSGYLLALMASLLWAFYTIGIGDLADKYDSGTISRKVFFYGILTIIPALLIEGKPFDFQALAIPEVYINFIFLCIIASLLGYVLWNVAIEHLGPVKSTNYIYLNPVFTLIGSIIILNEQVTWLSLLGSAVTLFGVWLASRKSLRIR